LRQRVVLLCVDTRLQCYDNNKLIMTLWWLWLWRRLTDSNVTKNLSHCYSYTCLSVCPFNYNLSGLLYNILVICHSVIENVSYREEYSLTDTLLSDVVFLVHDYLCLLSVHTLNTHTHTHTHTHTSTKSSHQMVPR